MEKITSVQNPKIKELIRNLSPKERRNSKLFAVEGLKLIHELALAEYEIICCFVLDTADLSLLPGQITDDLICLVSDNVMKKLSALTTPQNYIAIAREKESGVAQNQDFIIALDTIQDPSNLGAVLRSAEAFGVKSVILSEGCCDVYSSKSIRASMGSVFRLNVTVCDLGKYLAGVKKCGYSIIGTGLDKNYTTVDKLGGYSKKVVVIGNEGNGISDSVKNICDLGMYIPMAGENESLNAAVAASIIMWENLRQNNG